ncbi:haloacid dehalogenase type II [Sphingomonas sp. PAMC 26621]|uniref:haloacid dehalogenase type II n=1 Tax=Sphingomonas sp. PAMC 26621 TaxID=1112213 RepID=UPI000289A8CE|nr:haloacid dehalogenase type II [Sphingomonas sp. PAMC 26621]
MAFDVFGTVVDWRTSIAREASAFFAAAGVTGIDPHDFADAWRGLYQPAMEECRSGRRPYTRLDVLNHETLDTLLAKHGVVADPEHVADLTLAWRRLDPWPDSVAGLTRLKARFPIVTLSNGNVALMLHLARFGGLPWDAILGAEATGIYKPLPQAYLGTADILGIAPEELCLVAAHHSDLAAARACGLRTAYVDRPDELGGAPKPDRAAAQEWDYTAGSLTELADLLDAGARADF